MNEPLLDANEDRFVLFPVKYDDIWEKYQQALASFWVAEEIDLADDIEHWNSLNSNEQHFIKYVLAFFAAADGIVNENLGLRFMTEVQIPEARAFYAVQIMMEQIHNQTYSLLLDAYIKDPEERDQLFAAHRTIPVVKKKAEWALKWISSDAPFAQRLLAFACIEGIFFSGSFCAIFWIKTKGKMPGLTFSNELISRDEGLHVDFGCLLYSKLRERLPDNVVYELIKEAVTIEHEFVREALPVNLIGMNADLMCDYIDFVADRLLVSLGLEKAFGTPNPFPFMDQIGMLSKSNFFERRVSDYRKSGVRMSTEIAFDDDF